MQEPESMKLNKGTELIYELLLKDRTSLIKKTSSLPIKLNLSSKIISNFQLGSPLKCKEGLWVKEILIILQCQEEFLPCPVCMECQGCQECQECQVCQGCQGCQVCQGYQICQECLLWLTCILNYHSEFQCLLIFTQCIRNQVQIPFYQIPNSAQR